MASGPDHPDLFDLLPDPIFLLILNRVSDIMTLLRCRSVSKRFNTLVPQADTLLLRVDRVISASDSAFNDSLSFLSTLFKSLFTSLHHLLSFSPSGKLIEARSPNSPSEILRDFDAIKSLRIELPSGDLRLEKGTSIKWVARFGKTLQSCVILAFRNSGDSSNDNAGGGGLKMRVVWTISALIAASARHYMMADVVNEQHSLSHLVVNDRDNEGTVIMDKDGMREFRESSEDAAEEINSSAVWWRNNRTTVPAVGMRMRHEPKLEISGGMVMEGATLVVVRPVHDDGRRNEAADHGGDDGLVAAAFGKEGVYAEAVEMLLKSRSYILEMNSF
ncbi:F-box protein [Sesamum alatum]|uniref:F-box protein n=1 Tax=Sesamum alatum TaxID=300844 RepID=A0AAE2CND5_9LAMI|nr:F-box protein [Sesamum alatum]